MTSTFTIDDLGLTAFDACSLSDLGEDMLMARFDNKYVLHKSILPYILSALPNYYKILEIDNLRHFGYNSAYFDTPDLKCYLDHHNKRKNRYKFRSRLYEDSGISFFEIKHKNNKGFTEKERIDLPKFEETITSEMAAFIKDHTPYDPTQLFHSLKVRYKRITLVHKEEERRITIDTDLSFQRDSRFFDYQDLVIIEVKQEDPKPFLPLVNLFKKYKIYPLRISKYCVGIINVYPDIKHNNYKQKLRKLRNIESYGASIIG